MIWLIVVGVGMFLRWLGGKIMDIANAGPESVDDY